MGAIRFSIALLALSGLAVCSAASQGSPRKMLGIPAEVPEGPPLPLVPPMVPSTLTQPAQYQDRVVTVKQLVDKPMVVKETVVIQTPKVVYVDEAGQQTDTPTDATGRPRRTKVVMQQGLREQSRVEMGKEVVERTVVIKEPVNLRPNRPQPETHLYFPDPSLDASLKDGGYFVNSKSNPSPLVKPPVSDAEISECLRVLNALKLTLKGNTLLCPSNLGMARMSWAMGFPSVRALLAAATQGTKTYNTLLRVMRAHVMEGVWPRDSLESLAHRTLLTYLEPSSPVTIDVGDDGVVRVDGGSGERRRVVAADLGPSGMAYKAGVDDYIIHVIEAPALPPRTPFYVDDSVASGGPGGGARPVADLLRCWNEGDGDAGPNDDAIDANGNPVPFTDLDGDGQDDEDEWGCKKFKRFAPAHLAPGIRVNPVIGKETIPQFILGDPSAPVAPTRTSREDALLDMLQNTYSNDGTVVPGMRRRL